MVDDALALETRRRLYDAIVASPGRTAREVQRAAGTAWGETTYHLLGLEEAGHIHRERGPHQEFYFARAVPTGARARLRQSRSPGVRRILVALLESPELTFDELAFAARLSAARVSVHLRRLQETGAVASSRRDRLRVFRIGDRQLVGALLVQYRFGPADQAVDRLVEAWAELFPA